MTTYDAVVVGARCAGSVVAGSLARHGWKVLLVDKARFPSDTVSTHFMFPNLPGSSPRFGARVADLIGSGANGDPSRGVVLENGEEIYSRWVIGADGRASTVASLLGLHKTEPMAGEMAFLFAYWRGLQEPDFATIDVDENRNSMMRNPCEDGVQLLSVAGPAEITRGPSSERERAYARGLQVFPGSLDAAELDKAERISDAIEQAIYVADALSDNDPELEGFHHWRHERSLEHYETSFRYGSRPVVDFAHPYLRGLSADPVARQDWLDIFTRLNRPSAVATPERLSKWFSAPAP